MRNFYKNTIDKKPAKITIIQYANNGKKVEIIRDSQINDRETFAGFWVNESELIEKHEP